MNDNRDKPAEKPPAPKPQPPKHRHGWRYPIQLDVDPSVMVDEQEAPK